MKMQHMPQDRTTMLLTRARDRLRPKPAVYMVGGAVRDLLTGRTPADYDLVVWDRPRHYAQALAAVSSGRVVHMGKTGQIIYRVVWDDTVVDVAPPSGPSIEADLSRRDFTINAMAMDLSAGILVDPTGGAADIAGRKVRMVADTVFTADPVRLIRAYRIGAQLGFDLDRHTADGVRQNAGSIKASAGERIWHECLKMFQSDISTVYLRQMAANGLLCEIFPELAPLQGCRQTAPHTQDVLGHSLDACDGIEKMLGDLRATFPDTWRHVQSIIAGRRNALLKCALLLHDIGKPVTGSVDGSGRAHFYRHDRKGAEMVVSIGHRLKMSRQDIRYMTTVVGHHMRPLHLFAAHANGRLTRRALTRFFIHCGELAPDILIHSTADMMGKQGVCRSRTTAFITFADQMLKWFFDRFRPTSSLQPLITGHDLIAQFGLSPSPLFKKILAHVRENTLCGRIDNRQAALRLVESYLKRMGQKNPASPVSEDAG